MTKRQRDTIDFNDVVISRKKTKTQSTSVNFFILIINHLDNVDALHEKTMKAIRNNSSKIYVIENYFESNMIEMIDYLSLKTTNELKTLLLKFDLSDQILKSWSKSKKIDFDIKDKNENAQWTIKKLWNWLKDNEMNDQNWIHRTLSLSQEESFLDDDKEYIVWIVIMHQVLKVASHIVQDANKINVTKLHEYSFENWFRVYHILRHYHRLTNRIDNVKKNESFTFKRQDKLVKESLYLTQEQKSDQFEVKLKFLLSIDNNDLDANFNCLIEQNLKNWEINVEINRLMQRFKRRRESLSNVEFLKVFMQNYTNLLIQTIKKKINVDLQILNARNFRSRLSTNVQIALIIDIVKRVKILWSIVEDEIIVFSTIDIEIMIAQTFERNALILVEIQNMSNALSEESLSDVDIVTNVDRERFWELQTTLNAMSAKSSFYFAVCSKLHIDSLKFMILDFDWRSFKSKEKQNESKSTKRLKLWQIQFLTWARRVKIILFEFLLFDEMNFDKIVSALTYVVLYALEHEITVKFVEFSKMSIDNVDRASSLVHLDSIEDNEQSNLDVENMIQE